MPESRILTTCLCLAALAAPASAGKLERARQEVRSTNEADEPPKERRDRKRRRDRPRAGARSRGCGGPAVGFHFGDPTGPLAVEPPAVDYAVFPAKINRTWYGKIDLEVGGASDAVRRTGLAFLLENEARFGLDFDWDAYSEELAHGGHDELHVGQVNVTYRFFESENVAVRGGVGVGWLGDHLGTEGGINLTVQAEALLARRWTADLDFDLGTLGDAQTQHVSATLARRYGHFEVFGGYDYRRIGGVELNGPMVGLRLRW